MVGASKILTVSYGTFSCTLEGFDEPFNTMKAIAEYFRDLAADDRYFGAEPPTPDAAMLHQIAEREMKRRVEAKIQDNGVILRASGPSDASTAQNAPPAQLVRATVARPQPHARSQAEPGFDDHTIHAAPINSAPAQPDSMISDSVAAKLSRIRNAMLESRAEGLPTRPAAPIAAAFAPTEAEAESTAKQEAAALAEAEANAAAEQEAAALAEAEANAAAEQEAAALAEALTESDTAQQTETDDDAFLASLAGAFDDEGVAADGRFDDESAETAQSISAADAEGEDTLMASLAAALATPAAPVDAALPDDKEQSFAADENLFGGDLAEDDFADLSSIASETPQNVPDRQLSAAEINPTLQRARARVIKIRRAPVADTTKTTGHEGMAVNPADDTTLSPEAEADLMRELADVEADAPQVAEKDAADDAAQDGSVAPVRPQRPAAARRRGDDLTSSEDDASVKRLLDQTNSELQGTENRRRLSAIAHLKAAVAATVADRASGGDQGPTEEMRMNPYRSDLERAVRTRSATTAQTERPSPLVLVSEQRIDTPRVKPTTPPTHVTPVRPRRVPAIRATNEAEDAELEALKAALEGPFESKSDAPKDQTETAANALIASSSFADYAEKMGAESLSSLLEAAVAYAAQIEGRAEVTRPQMVEHVLTVQPDLEDDRETLLRSFGSLLRDGRIEKASRGHFVLGQSSAFQAEPRKVAQG